MSAYLPNDVAASMQEQLAAQQARWSELTNKTLESVIKLVDVGLKATRDSMAESAMLTQHLISANSPQDFLSFGAEEGKSNIERMLAYGGDVAAITSNIQGEISKAAQAEFADSFQRASLLVESMSHGMPDDSKSPYSMMKFAIDNANSGYEQWASMTKQMAEAMDANLSSATSQFSSSKKAVVRPRKGNGRE